MCVSKGSNINMYKKNFYLNFMHSHIRSHLHKIHKYINFYFKNAGRNEERERIKCTCAETALPSHSLYGIHICT